MGRSVNPLPDPAIGQRFGTRTVTGLARDKYNHPVVLVRCDCGRTAQVNRYDLWKGKADQCRHCADVAAQNSRRTLRSNGYRHLYSTWAAMIQRCTNPQSPSYADYGGRGIKVCQRWAQSFDAFVLDMGNRPDASHSVDRINNDGDYTPDNTRWATPVQQANNSRHNVFLEFQGERLTLSEWARKLGVNAILIGDRLRRGWSIHDAFTVPSRPREHLVTYQGETLRIAEWARRTGISRHAIKTRLHNGWSVEKSLTTPVNDPR